MEIREKLRILADSAKYDVSCSSSGSDRKNNGGVGSAAISGICHSWSDDGRCISLLKILFSNNCIYDCSYCVNRATNDVERATFTPREVAELTINFYRRNYIEGLFLSSAVIKSPDHTMELMLTAVREIRFVHQFSGYIHMKAIPGASNALIEEAGNLVDRMSVNIELPSMNSLALLAPQKKREAILTPMGLMKSKINIVREERKLYRHAPLFIPAGQTTQLIVGATPEHDISILKLSESLYDHFSLKRVYYSAYVPVATGPLLPAIAKPPLLREHRLYQADWLLRFYGFKADELLDERAPDFDLELDPKSHWALSHLEFFPIEVNRAEYEMLLRIPGIGVKSAKKIQEARRVQILTMDSLKKLGVVLKRARHFITCNGRYGGEQIDNPGFIRGHLLTGKRTPEETRSWARDQVSFFPVIDPFAIARDRTTSLSGEL